MKLSLIFITVSSMAVAQQWRVLVKEDFGNQAVPHSRSQNPIGELLPGITDYIPLTDNTPSNFSFNDGYFMVGSSSMAPRNAVTQSVSFISGVMDHTVDDPAGTYGNLFAINANPSRQGESNGSYYLYQTSIFDIPGANYRISFWGANLLKTTTNGKDGHVGLAVRHTGNTPTSIYFHNSWTLPKTTDVTHTTLPWQNMTLSFSLPLDYTGNALSFNFYNSDTDSSTSGNDLVLDDIVIEMQVVNVSGNVFYDRDGNGLKDGVDTPYNGITNELYAYAVSSSNKVLGRAQVQADGSYSFSGGNGIPASNSNIGLKIILSSYLLNNGDLLTSANVLNRTTVSENVSLSSNSSYLTTGAVDGVIYINRSDVNLDQLNFGLKPLCYKPAATTGAAMPAQHGITSLARGNGDSSGWPSSRKGAHTVLESKTKGFVVNRVSDVNIIPAVNLVEGMMLYDTADKCLKVYMVDVLTPENTGWFCLDDPSCPE